MELFNPYCDKFSSFKRSHRKGNCQPQWEWLLYKLVRLVHAEKEP